MFCKFNFDGINSDAFGVMNVSFGNVNNTVEASGKTEFDTIKSGNDNIFHIIKQDYTNPLSIMLTLINKDFSNITLSKQRQLIKWLCHNGIYKDFTIEKQEYENIVYQVNISNPELIVVNGVNGMQFTLTTNSPFAYTTTISNAFEINHLNKSITIDIDTDNKDYIYPTLEIEMLQSGDLEISNSTESNLFRRTGIKNVSVGEKIIINSESPIITTSNDRNIYDNFNKFWIRLIDGINTLTFNLNCNVKINYREVRKVGLY